MLELIHISEMFLLQLYHLLEQEPYRYTVFAIILSLVATALAKDLFVFPILMIIMAIIGFIFNIYPFWLLAIIILIMIAFALSKKSFGTQLRSIRI